MNLTSVSKKIPASMRRAGVDRSFVSESNMRQGHARTISCAATPGISRVSRSTFGDAPGTVEFPESPAQTKSSRPLKHRYCASGRLACHLPMLRPAPQPRGMEERPFRPAVETQSGVYRRLRLLDRHRTHHLRVDGADIFVHAWLLKPEAELGSPVDTAGAKEPLFAGDRMRLFVIVLPSNRRAGTDLDIHWFEHKIFDADGRVLAHSRKGQHRESAGDKNPVHH